MIFILCIHSLFTQLKYFQNAPLTPFEPVICVHPWIMWFKRCLKLHSATIFWFSGWRVPTTTAPASSRRDPPHPGPDYARIRILMTLRFYSVRHETTNVFYTVQMAYVPEFPWCNWKLMKRNVHAVHNFIWSYLLHCIFVNLGSCPRG
jgi:hypothetical protein